MSGSLFSLVWVKSVDTVVDMDAGVLVGEGPVKIVRHGFVVVMFQYEYDKL